MDTSAPRNPKLQVSVEFTAEAGREASRDGAPPIELIDGEKLVGMFKELELGLKPVKTYEIDDSFFEEFRNRQKAAGTFPGVSRGVK